MSARWLDPVVAGKLVAAGTTAFRLASGPGCQVERFGTSALISVRSEHVIGGLSRELETWCAAAGWLPARTFQRLLVRGPGGNDTPSLLGGDAGSDPREVVQESGLAFEVDFSTGYSPGLFCDQRANRDFLRSLRPSRLLNTFAHTCAFSVAAASAGAQTVSVDLSKSSLLRGRRNFELNGLETAGHRFVPEDAPAYLARLDRRGERFDAIILDPPTFGRGRGKRTFRIERDFPGLVRAALAVTAPGAHILLSTNFQEWSSQSLRAWTLKLFPAGTRVEIAPPGPDCRDGAHPAGVWAGPVA
ncbi:MAG: class I SAM-dependent methyltransferase [Verrucomicrobiae bacterium]